MKERKFETNVQRLKYNALKEVAKLAWDGKLQESYYEIPKKVISGKQATMRCCIYKERAIFQERVKMAMGGYEDNPNVIQVIDIACDECPVQKIKVTESCRGCIAHRCANACRKNAIHFEGQHAVIDPDQCVGCGQCVKACPYGAIVENIRPCERSCKVNAIKMGDDQKAVIDNSKCISCGACVYMCPFGAVVDKSFICDLIEIIKNSENNTKYPVYAVIAPAIAAQFDYASIGQIITAIKQLGFADVIEAALGADLVAYKESMEIVEKGFLTSSCCPAFKSYIEKHVPSMAKHISHNYSPMVEIGRHIKALHPDCKICFIGPCTAKKAEFQREDTDGHIDCAITFEELQALIDSKEIEPSELEESALNNASYYGRIFARSGGVTEAAAEALKEQGSDFVIKAEVCDGIEACKVALLKASKGVLDANFIEGMACVNGCIGGPAAINHAPRNKADIDKYGKMAKEQDITGSISVMKAFNPDAFK
ncbi:MAG: 4Fe-4S dicluster domain-containing protein [Erysipelotrichaceae bacterium]|nr:4Fe-4S dicluster domain-containing protein [Erysipelotrichaceae bacterium]